MGNGLSYRKKYRDRIIFEDKRKASLRKFNHFPQKAIDRDGSSTQYCNATLVDTSISGSDNDSYIYLQQQYVPPKICNTTGTTVYVDEGKPHLFVQHNPHNTHNPHPTHNFSSCHHHQHHQQQQLLPAGGIHCGLSYNDHEATHENSGGGDGGAAYAYATERYYHRSGDANYCNATMSAQSSGSHKKCSVRTGNEIIKRSRAQAAYELSQDLLEKQIELLERKYGGIRARYAAIIIQRAFRLYMMVKKFASITAMAKTDKRLNRAVMIVEGNNDTRICHSTLVPNMIDGQNDSVEQLTTAHRQQTAQTHTVQPQVMILPTPSVGISHAAGPRIPPTRSLSMRERRKLDCSTKNRIQSGISNASITCSSSSASMGCVSNHPHVNLLHATDSHYYRVHNVNVAQVPVYYGNYHAAQTDGGYSNSGNTSMLDSSLNDSWANTNVSSSPHAPYYSASQIYMRPRGSSIAQERKKIPPEVPKRTSSIAAPQHVQQMLLIKQASLPSAYVIRSNVLYKSSENGSLISVQSSGSDSSITSAERNAINDLCSNHSNHSNSPNTWSRITPNAQQCGHASEANYDQATAVSGATSIAASSATGTGAGVTTVTTTANSMENVLAFHTNLGQYEQHDQHPEHGLDAALNSKPNYKVSETLRKRQYRVGLNLFNKKPEKGITYLIRRGFLENTPQGVARFLITRKGLSRQMIGEYLGNLQNAFNMAVLNCFALELDLTGMKVDVALRKFQAYFRMPGEAQKIERLMEIFSQRYGQCNQDIVGQLRSSDTIFVLAFAIIMLNTDLHTPSLKPERKMRLEDFIKNLRGIDDCHDIDREMLVGIYERVKANEFKPGSDHVTQVMKVQATIVGKKPNLALPHRRLVCYCRLYEIPDINKKERPGVHQREVFLFNDLLVITKIFSKKKSSVTYTFRNSFSLCGMVVSLLDVPNYPYCVRLSQKLDGKTLITFNARNEHDRCKFAEDLKESICEMDEMEVLRIETELERQKLARPRTAGSTENRDSGVADIEVCPCPFQSTQSNELIQTASEAVQLKRSALSNSLLDIHDQFGVDKPQRRGSVGSLDSGMSISFQSTATSNASRDNTAITTTNTGNVIISNKIRIGGAGGVAAGSGAAAAVSGVYIPYNQYNNMIYKQQHQHQQQQQQIVIQKYPQHALNTSSSRVCDHTAAAPPASCGDKGSERSTEV